MRGLQIAFGTRDLGAVARFERVLDIVELILERAELRIAEVLGMSLAAAGGNVGGRLGIGRTAGIVGNAGFERIDLAGDVIGGRGVPSPAGAGLAILRALSITCHSEIPA